MFCGSRAEVVLRPIFLTRLRGTRGLISLKFSFAVLVYTVWLQSRSCFVAILVPDSVERFSLVWVLRLGVLSLGVRGVVLLLVQVRCLGKY